MKKTPAPKFAMNACKSSQVASHGYDAATRTLAVKFHGGGEYHYADVSPADYAALGKAKSIGGHIHANVKGKFKHKKIGD